MENALPQIWSCVDGMMTNLSPATIGKERLRVLHKIEEVGTTVDMILQCSTEWQDPIAEDGPPSDPFLPIPIVEVEEMQCEPTNTKSNASLDDIA
jgi:hypothetical protein